MPSDEKIATCPVCRKWTSVVVLGEGRVRCNTCGREWAIDGGDAIREGEPDLVLERAELLRFRVDGIPQQRGSKSPVLVGKRGGGYAQKNGRPIIATKDDNPKSKPWMAAVSAAAAEAWRDRELLRDAVALSIRFEFPRPNKHYGSRKGLRYLRPDAPFHVCKTPDLDKLVRAISDALSGVVFADDKQIVALRDVKKVYTDGSAGAVVSLFRVS